MRYSYQSIQRSNDNDSFSGYAFAVDKKWLRQDYKRYRGLHSNRSYPYDQEFVSAPLVLEWELDNPEQQESNLCRYAEDYRYFSSYADEYIDASTSLRAGYYTSRHELVSSIKYCSCGGGSEGNPYLLGGCIDINECALNSTDQCSLGMICINMNGGYWCDYANRDSNISKANIAFISIGSALGGVILLFGAWMSVRAIRKRIKAKRRQVFFKRNGGLLLQQQLSSTDSSLEKTKLFCYKELAQATDHYNENRILGHGGQGTVYKGMLTDGRIVAVKKSKKVEEGDLENFINEVVILTQVSHRNVVKLLGCCLEAEVPLLVYEFIPNGTLFQHVHDPSEDFHLSWEMRLRIAREVAGALAYLHSAASAPIYHRDIKSSNILLDDKYRAKVSDFGASRSIAIDQTHLTTRVLGTFGYLDPEYFQSSQFTEKSDVYSFGVVMVELLTGEKAISSIRAEVGKSLATHFLHSMEEDQLFDILDARVLEEGKREEIMAVAQLARRCLYLNGKRRPTMKEVTIELEGIQMVKLKEEESINNQNQDYSKECDAVELDQSYDFSSITKSMHFNANAITPCPQDDHRPLLDS
ncbi:Wall-associated kinase family protein [Perilla frutescens var. hirtella]|nr:Wall-associated kinase family protein [Perilla frutescens var. hirtella]